ncbi:MAG: LacI family DNA-binding transcriptional regulator [Fermentimonas sp.]|nr:LacI family DNA-binding transcriptional regulator [Fermentimonas sp.]
MEKKIRIKDIAKMAGVSAGTVDRVLHNRGNVSDEARKAVEKVIEQVDYKPNMHVSSLSLKRKYKIVVTTPQFSRGAYWESMHNGIRNALEEYENIKVDYHVLTYNQYDIYSCREIFEKISQFDMDALIIGPTFKEETIDLCNKMDEREIPYIFVDSTIDETSPLAFFSADHYTVGRLIAHLITSIIPKGANIGLLQAVRTGDSSANTTILRKRGFTDYLTEEKKNNRILMIPFSVARPEDNERHLSSFFKNHDDVPGIVVMNSRGSIVSDYLENNSIKDVKMICMDVTTPNTAALKKGKIDFLIGQGPEYQGFYAMKTLLEYLIFKNPVKVEHYMQLDILTSETIEYYNELKLNQLRS